MALKPCRECGKQVSSEAKACPHCGVNDPAPTASSKTAQGCAVVGCGVSVILLVIVIAGILSTDAPQGPIGARAYSMCQDFVERQLRSPAAADFPRGYSDYTTSLSGARFRVRSYVDAENASGGTVRIAFECVVKHEGGDSWSLESLDVE